jgi:4-hydroxy-tetrahydrodipicolinate reductase
VRKKIRVVQYGVGPIGAGIVRLMREKQALEIIGAIDRDPEKAGRDLGELVGAPDAPWGIPVSAEAGPVLGRNADVVIHSTSSILKDVAGQLLECIEAGSCVISTCEELAYPFRKYPELSKRLDAEAKEWGVALVGTGVNPGFVMDKLVLTLATVSQRVDAARALRIVDASRRRLPLQKKIGAGLSLEEFREKVAAGVIKHQGLPESVAMVADGHQIARGLGNGKELVHLELKMYVGAKESCDAIELRGEPDIRLTIPGGTHGDVATAAVVVNCIPAILAAPAGLRTARELPMCFFPPGALP